VPRACRADRPCTATTPTELTPLEKFAIAKALPKSQLELLRPRLEAGPMQEVDLTVRIRGCVNVAEDASSTATVNAGADKVLACVLSHVSARARKNVLDAVRTDFAGYCLGGELPAIADGAVDLADDLINAASRLENKPKKGAVSAALAIELVERGGD